MTPDQRKITETQLAKFRAALADPWRPLNGWKPSKTKNLDAPLTMETTMPETVHEAVGDNLVPQGPSFHWRNGWMFARGEALDVHVWNIKRGIDLIIPRAEWDSLVKSLDG